MSIRRISRCPPWDVPSSGTPAWVPAGGFGLEVTSLTSSWIVAERMVYGGPNWEIGHASPGVRTHVGTGTTLRFADGTSAGMFETYFLLTNMAGVATPVTLTYRTSAGALIGADPLVIPAYGRGTVWANGTTGGRAGQDFTTGVISTQEILAERAMYWPTGISTAGRAETRCRRGAEELTRRSPNRASSTRHPVHPHRGHARPDHRGRARRPPGGGGW